MTQFRLPSELTFLYSTNMQLSEDSTTSCILPFEIAEIIIDLLAEENDIDSLKAMSLVCQSVLPRCRKYLFFSLKIETTSTEKCLALSSPHTDIPKYIRRLEYQVYGHTLFPNHTALLERISFLQSFTLTAFSAFDFHWIYMDTSARSTFLNLMHLPTLTHLYLQCIPDFIVSDLFSCANLKHLQLVSVGITDEAPCTFLPSESDNFIVPRIQEYSFRGYSAEATMRLSTAKLVDGRFALDFTNLKKLSVILGSDEDVKATLSLLRKSRQVEELQICGK